MEVRRLLYNKREKKKNYIAKFFYLYKSEL